MLTNDATNRLDAINDAMALVTLMDELIGHRNLKGQINLSDRAADGLGLVLGHVAEVLGEAATGLTQARDAVRDQDEADSRAVYERGFREGAAAVAMQMGEPEGGDERESNFLFGVTMGAFGVMWETGERDDEMKRSIHNIKEAAREAYRHRAQADGASPSPSGPSLTEPVPDQERADLHQDRQSA